MRNYHIFPCCMDTSLLSYGYSREERDHVDQIYRLKLQSHPRSHRTIPHRNTRTTAQSKTDLYPKISKTLPSGRHPIRRKRIRQKLPRRSPELHAKQGVRSRYQANDYYDAADHPIRRRLSQAFHEMGAKRSEPQGASIRWV